MKIEQPTFSILNYTTNIDKTIEYAGRTCYNSIDKMCEGSSDEFIEKIQSFKHLSCIEHGSITCELVTDRGVMAELTRHRVASFSVQSTRYCNFSKTKYNKEITVIEPYFWAKDSVQYAAWYDSCCHSEDTYNYLTANGATAQEARSVLPNSLKTIIVMTANPREWKHVFDLRCHRDAHPQCRQLMIPVAVEFAKRWPSLFGEYAGLTHDCSATEVTNELR